MPKIALERGGGLGDVIMLLNMIPPLQKKYDVVHLISASADDHMKPFLKDYLFIDEVSKTLPLPEEEYDKIIAFGIYNMDGSPRDPFPNHLLHYWSKEAGVYPPDFNALRAKAPPLPKKIKDRNSPLYITIQTQAEWSIYKNWWGWQELTNKIKKLNPDIKIYQIGGISDPPLENIDGSFLGDSWCDNLYAQAWASAHLGLDSVFNHTSNIIWSHKGKTKSVILFGSTQASAYGYVHNENISLHLFCQPCARLTPGKMSNDMGPQTPCVNLVKKPNGESMWACMDGISINLVYDNLIKILKDKRFISLNPEIRHTNSLREYLEFKP